MITSRNRSVSLARISCGMAAMFCLALFSLRTDGQTRQGPAPVQGSGRAVLPPPTGLNTNTNLSTTNLTPTVTVDRSAPAPNSSTTIRTAPSSSSAGPTPGGEPLPDTGGSDSPSPTPTAVPIPEGSDVGSRDNASSHSAVSSISPVSTPAGSQTARGLPLGQILVGLVMVVLIGLGVSARRSGRR